MDDNSPAIIMIAGPNGAGKTTLAYELVPKMLEKPIFLNTDEIARGLSPLDAELSAIQAGKIFIERMDNFISENKSWGCSRSVKDLATNAMLGLGYAVIQS